MKRVLCLSVLLLCTGYTYAQTVSIGLIECMTLADAKKTLRKAGKPELVKVIPSSRIGVYVVELDPANRKAA
jgi:hypothetical protein